MHEQTKLVLLPLVDTIYHWCVVDIPSKREMIHPLSSSMVVPLRYLSSTIICIPSPLCIQNASLDLAATLDQYHYGNVSTTRTDSTAQLLPCQNVHDNRDRTDGQPSPQESFEVSNLSVWFVPDLLRV
jgi:hypothetical protein